MKITIELPDDIVKKLEKESKDMGFETTEEFIEYVVLDYISSKDSTQNSEDMEKKLRDLGYF